MGGADQHLELLICSLRIVHLGSTRNFFDKLGNVIRIDADLAGYLMLGAVSCSSATATNSRTRTRERESGVRNRRGDSNEETSAIKHQGVPTYLFNGEGREARGFFSGAAEPKATAEEAKAACNQVAAKVARL